MSWALRRELRRQLPYIWALGSLSGFVPPEGIEVVHVWADKDRSHAGDNAAKNLASRLRQQGQRVEIHLPELELGQDAKSVDWLDVWNLQGTQGFCSELSLRSLSVELPDT